MKRESKKVLVAPLNWGLGHATRCVPIINCLVNLELEVILAASGRSADFLRITFPDLELIDFPDYGMTHPVKGSFAWHLIKKSGAVFRSIREENEVLKKMVKEHQIDAVISDNRYGLHHPEIPTVLITHQLNIQAPLPLRGWLRKIVRGFVKNFNECWVPDFEGSPNLSGKLSHGKGIPENVRFVGPLSRFSDSESEQKEEEAPIDYLALISGPEPQRTHFEKEVFKEFLGLEGKRVLICGKPDSEGKSKESGIEQINYLGGLELESFLRRSKVITCRPGYSTLMDLFALGKGAVLIPTPGQTEQKYLAKHWSKFCEVQDQKSMDLKKATEVRPFPKQEIPSLQKQIENWLERAF
ncbi:glycosyltransferase [Halocola ammonii]